MNKEDLRFSAAKNKEIALLRIFMFYNSRFAGQACLDLQQLMVAGKLTPTLTAKLQSLNETVSVTILERPPGPMTPPALPAEGQVFRLTFESSKVEHPDKSIEGVQLLYNKTKFKTKYSAGVFVDLKFSAAAGHVAIALYSSTQQLVGTVFISRIELFIYSPTTQAHIFNNGNYYGVIKYAVSVLPLQNKPPAPSPSPVKQQNHSVPGTPATVTSSIQQSPSNSRRRQSLSNKPALPSLSNKKDQVPIIQKLPQLHKQSKKQPKQTKVQLQQAKQQRPRPLKSQKFRKSIKPYKKGKASQNIETKELNLPDGAAIQQKTLKPSSFVGFQATGKLAISSPPATDRSVQSSLVKQRMTLGLESGKLKCVPAIKPVSKPKAKPPASKTVTGHQLGTGLFSGLLVEGVPSGQGRIEYPNGNWFQGNLVSGTRQGPGKEFIKATKEEFEGQFWQGVRQGKGVLKKEGIAYKGLFRNGELEGEVEVAVPGNKVRRALFKGGVRKKWIGPNLRKEEPGQVLEWNNLFVGRGLENGNFVLFVTNEGDLVLLNIKDRKERVLAKGGRVSDPHSHLYVSPFGKLEMLQGERRVWEKEFKGAGEYRLVLQASGEVVVLDSSEKKVLALQ